MTDTERLDWLGTPAFWWNYEITGSVNGMYLLDHGRNREHGGENLRAAIDAAMEAESDE